MAVKRYSWPSKSLYLLWSCLGSLYNYTGDHFHLHNVPSCTFWLATLTSVQSNWLLPYIPPCGLSWMTQNLKLNTRNNNNGIIANKLHKLYIGLFAIYFDWYYIFTACRLCNQVNFLALMYTVILFRHFKFTLKYRLFEPTSMLRLFWLMLTPMMWAMTVLSIG